MARKKHSGSKKRRHKGKKHRHWGHVKGHARRVNPRTHRRSRRRHRRHNPDVQMLLKVGLGVAAGVAASIVGGLAIDTALPQQSSNVKNLALVALAAGAAIFIGNPFLAGGIATGLLLRPGQDLVAKLMPAKAAAGLGLLYGGNQLAALYAPGQMGALYGANGIGDMGASDAADDALLSRYGIHV